MQAFVTRTPEHAHWLAHFCWGLLIVTAKKGYHIQMLVHWLLYLGFHIVTTCFYVWLWYKRESIKTLGNLINTRGLRPPRTNQIAFCFDVLSITYLSLDSILAKRECTVFLHLYDLFDIIMTFNKIYVFLILKWDC
jgi:hypothetical protein